MWAQEASCNLRTADCPGGLIIPAHIHDEKDFPQFALAIQGAQLQPYTNVRLSKRSRTEEQLSSEIRNLVPNIASAIRNVPPHDQKCADLAVPRFVKQFDTTHPVQTAPPTLV